MRTDINSFTSTHTSSQLPQVHLFNLDFRHRNRSEACMQRQWKRSCIPSIPPHNHLEYKAAAALAYISFCGVSGKAHGSFPHANAW